MNTFDYLLQVIRTRGSTRDFNPDYVIPTVVSDYLLRSLDLGPSAGGLYAYSVYHTSDPDKKILLQEAGLDQKFIHQASIVFVIAANPPKSMEKYGDRGELYAIQDATIAGMNLTFMATSLSLQTCWVGSIDPQAVREILIIPKYEIPISLICVGKHK